MANTDDSLFYIQVITTASLLDVNGLAKWVTVDGIKITGDLTEAGLFTREQAESLVGRNEESRDKLVLRPKAVVDDKLVHAVFIDDLSPPKGKMMMHVSTPTHDKSLIDRVLDEQQVAKMNVTGSNA